MSTTKTTKTTKVDAKAVDKENVKTTAGKAEAKKEAPKAAAVKAEVKKEAPKAAAVKAEVKKEAPKAAAVKAEVKKEAPKAAAAKKPAAKKAPAKKATTKATEEVFIEYAGSQVSTSDIVARVVEATGKKASAIKALNVYVQPETGKIYYTADGVTGEIAY